MLASLFVDVNLATNGHPSRPKPRNGICQLALCAVQTQPNSSQLFSGANSFASALTIDRVSSHQSAKGYVDFLSGEFELSALQAAGAVEVSQLQWFFPVTCLIPRQTSLAVMLWHNMALQRDSEPKADTAPKRLRHSSTMLKTD